MKIMYFLIDLFVSIDFIYVINGIKIGINTKEYLNSRNDIIRASHDLH